MITKLYIYSQYKIDDKDYINDAVMTTIAIMTTPMFIVPMI